MNKFLLATTILFAGIALYLFLNPGDKMPDGFVNCYTGTNAETKFDGIEAPLVKVMLEKYRTNHWANYKIDGVDSMDSRSVWFSLKRLKTFINLIETKACENGCTKELPELGIRMYFAEYPDSLPKAGDIALPWESYPHLANGNVPIEYQKHHTLILVPTIDLEKNVHLDFDPSKDFKDCKPGNLAEIMKAQIEAFDKFLKDHRPESLAPPETQAFVLSPILNRTVMNDPTTANMNKGGLWPPPPVGLTSSGMFDRPCSTGTAVGNFVDDKTCY